MKFRLGFVSNSSSSSFCIVGKLYSEKELQSKLQTEYIYDAVYDSCSKNIDIHNGIEIYMEDDYCIGLNISRINDNETMGDFKQKVLKEIQSFDETATINDIQILIDGGHNG